MPELTDAELVSKLLAATRNGKVGWEKTATQDEYAASYGGKWTVQVDKEESERGGDYLYYITIKNAAGDEILRIWNNKYGLVSQLFEQARRHALKVNEAVSDLLKSLGEEPAEQQSGEESGEISDEDIPF